MPSVPPSGVVLKWGLVVVLLLGVAVFFSIRFIEDQGQSNSSESHAPVATHFIGDLSAHVRVYVYTDFECPHCKKFHESHLQRMIPKFGNSIVVIYKNFPRTVHPGAYAKAQVAECVSIVAGEAAYWKYVRQLFSTQPPEMRPDGPDAPYTAAGAIGVDVNALRACVASGRGTIPVESDLAEVKALGATATPAIYITGNGKQFLIQGDRGSGTEVAILDALKTK